jgi:hypothetical protein
MAAWPGEVAYQAPCWALQDAETVQRYRSKVVTVPGSSCSWWSGAVSGRGHGRQYFGWRRCRAATWSSSRTALFSSRSTVVDGR